MKAPAICRLVFATGTIAIVGCGISNPAAMQVGPGMPTQPFVSYDKTDDPSEWTSALSDVELREIVDWMATQTPKPVWLIRVKPSLVQGKRGSAIAYLVPDRMTPRLRTGRAYNVRNSYSPPWRYAQVSMPDERFPERFAKPSLAEMPFEWPTFVDPNSGEELPMADDEVLAIADFVRRPSSYEGLSVREGTSKERRIREILQSPILWIKRNGFEVEVTLGFMHGPLWGRGLMVTLECAPAGYKVKTWGFWIS